MGSSVAEDRQVEPAKALGVADQVDPDDLPPLIVKPNTTRGRPPVAPASAGGSSGRQLRRIRTIGTSQITSILTAVFGPGGEVVAAIELAVGDLGKEQQPVMAASSIAARSLSRELAGEARPGPRSQPRCAHPLTASQPDVRVAGGVKRSATGEDSRSRACGPLPGGIQSAGHADEQQQQRHLGVELAQIAFDSRGGIAELVEHVGRPLFVVAPDSTGTDGVDQPVVGEDLQEKLLAAGSGTSSPARCRSTGRVSAGAAGRFC
ncbi:hypothetical protein ACVGVM_10540 [Pseudonocardia bannensis]